jgi:FlaA1/EpsC-like NDP-sugar epimerase
MIMDLFFITLSYFAAYGLRFDGKISPEYFTVFLQSLPLVIFVYFVILLIMGLYRGMWKYASIRDLGLILIADALGIFILFFLFWLLWPIKVPRGILLIFGIITVCCLGGVRFAYRFYNVYWPLLERSNKRLLIVGAGNSGEMIVRQLFNDPGLNYHPICFVDDAPDRLGKRIHGVPISGTIADIPKLVRKKHIDEIILAVPSASASQMRRIVEFCEQIQLPFKTLPGVKEIIDGKVTFSKIRPLQLEDLLERIPSVSDKSILVEHFNNKVVLVTGAAGSIGSELCRQLIYLQPKLIVLLDQAESDLFNIQHELLRLKGPKAAFKTVIANITQETKLNTVFDMYRPDIVFHAAAYKHVPLMEEHPDEAVRNNVFGTMNVVKAAERVETRRFVLISTDKAVNPTSIMGATKRLNELYCMSYNKKSGLKQVAVRFGNVLGSQGSVIPLFQEQIRSGGPVTVTSTEIVRYFMTIPESVELVLHASIKGNGGEIFVLDMGEPINVYEMAKHFIALSGLELGKDIEIQITGLRPGEKLYEELWTGEEKPDQTDIPRILRVANTVGRRNHLSDKSLQRLQKAMESCDNNSIRKILMDIIPSAKL